MPGAAEVRALFRQFLREGKNFPNYNIREYILRRARQGFRAPSEAPAEARLQKATDELQVVKRQSLVYQLYGRKLKNVLELDSAAASHGKGHGARPRHLLSMAGV